MGVACIGLGRTNLGVVDQINRRRLFGLVCLLCSKFSLHTIFL